MSTSKVWKGHSMSLNEIRVMREILVKRKIPFSAVSDKDKKIYRQLHEKGIIDKGADFWKIKPEGWEVLWFLLSS